MTTLVHEPPFQADTGTRHGGSGTREQRPSRVNVGEKERNVSMAAGAIVALQGLSRMSLAGLLEAAVGGFLIYRGASGQCPVYQSLGLDTYHTDGRPPADEITEKGVHVEQSMLIQKPAEELYAFWHSFENLPRIMTHLASVKRTGDGRTHWEATVPKLFGARLEWDAEVTADEPNRRIGWRSLPGSQVETVGEVRFERAPGDRGTYVHATMSYVPPAGKLGHLLAWLLNETPQTKMRDDLRNFKRLMETGEIVTIIGGMVQNRLNQGNNLSLRGP
jgi:uncharacterized membrane protein